MEAKRPAMKASTRGALLLLGGVLLTLMAAWDWLSGRAQSNHGYESFITSAGCAVMAFVNAFFVFRAARAIQNSNSPLRGIEP